MGTENKKDEGDASIITRLIADSIAFVFGLLIIAPVFAAIASALMVVFSMHGMPVLGLASLFIVLGLATYVIYRLFRHVREDPKRQIRPIVREIRRFTDDLRGMWGEDGGEE